MQLMLYLKQRFYARENLCEFVKMDLYTRTPFFCISNDVHRGAANMPAIIGVSEHLGIIRE